MKNADLPAMPIELNGHGQYAPMAYTGLTKREMFAMTAMQGILSCGEWVTAEGTARTSIEMADALLAKLDEAKGE